MTPSDGGPDRSDITARLSWLRQQLELTDEWATRAQETIAAAEFDLLQLRTRRASLEIELNALAAAVQTTSVQTTAAPPVQVPSTEAPPVFAPVGVDRPAMHPLADPRQAETSTRTVQNVLFVLGGLLLGTAAIAFTAVAWATFGETGRALVLATVTLIMLSIPLIALSRGLRATAETFAAVGLLLVILDGYALWYINIANVQSIPPARYAGLVALVSGAVALGYRLVTRLVGPGFPAVLLAQPVLILLVEPDRPAPWALSLIASATAAFNVFVIALLNRAQTRGPSPSRAALRQLTWVVFGVWVAVAGSLAALAEVGETGPRVSDRVEAGLALVIAAVVLVAAAMVQRAITFLVPATGVLVIAVATAFGFVVATAQPSHALLLVAAVAACTSLIVAVVLPFLSRDLRAGPRGGALVVAGGVFVAVAGISVVAAGLTVSRSFPIWTAGIDPPHPPEASWELPVSALLICVAFAAVARSHNRLPLVALGGLVAILALPDSIPLPWWAPALIALAAAAVALVAAMAGRTVQATGGAAACGAILAAFAVLTSLIRPSLTAAVLAGITGLGIALAVVAARSPQRGADRLAVGGFALTVGLVSLPPAIGSALVAGHLADQWAARGMVIGLLPVLAVVAAVAALSRAEGARAWPAIMARYGFLGLAIGAIAWPAVAASVPGEPKAVYAAVSLLAVALATVAMGPDALARPVPTVSIVDSAPSTVDEQPARPSDVDDASPPYVSPLPRMVPAPRPGLLQPNGGIVVTAMLAALPGLVALAVTVAPAVLGVVGGPYGWIGAIWSGRPAGVGLVPAGVRAPEPVTLADAAALAILALASATVGYALTRRLRPALGGLGIGGPTAILVGLTALGAPWPALPAAMLAIAGVLLLVAGIVPLSPNRTAIATAQGLVYLGAGVTGSLSERWSTLTSFALVLVGAAVVGAVGRSPQWRVAGWLVAAGAALTLAIAGGFAADLPARQVAFGVLGAAVLTLFVGVVIGGGLGRTLEARAIHVAAQAGGLVALLFTVGFPGYASAVSVMWGIAVGLRAVSPGTSRAERAALAAVAGAYELLAWWLLLSDHGVTVIEAYTLPLALVALLAGWAALRARPDLRSWVAYGPALAAGFLPSLAAIIGVAGDPWRRLALGAAAIAVVMLGATTRRQAPVVIGGIVLAVVALHELVLLWQLLPGWIPLAAGGVILVGLAITYERRLRDLGRLRSAVGRMT